MSEAELPDLEQERAAEPPGGGESGRMDGVVEEFEGADSASMAAVMELEVPVTIELGRTRMAVEDVLALGRGSVIQLDRLVGQPIEVYVSDRPFATGEVVVLGEKFGVRILRIRESAPKAAQVS
ncbi:MAG: flagellar motor switch protein FliN [Gemmatimonadota bacterium]